MAARAHAVTGPQSIKAVRARVLRRSVIAGMTALALGAAAAAPAMAVTSNDPTPPRETGRTCKPGYLFFNIGGRVINNTDVKLERIHVQTGFLNIDAPVPRPEVAPHGINKWCIKAANIPLAGAEIGLEYRLPNGDRVSFNASVFPVFFGGGSEGCHVNGPHHAYTCRATRTHPGPHADVDFVVAPAGH